MYVTAGDNFYFTVVIKDRQGNKINLREGVDKGLLIIRINDDTTTIQARITDGEFSFYVGSEITRQKPYGGRFHYEIKHIKLDNGATENQAQDLITTIIPLSFFIIERSLLKEDHEIDYLGTNTTGEI